MTAQQLERANTNLTAALGKLEMTKPDDKDPVLIGIEMAELATELAKQIGTAGAIDVLIGMAQKLATMNANTEIKH